MLVAPLPAQDVNASCSSCAVWNKPQRPFRIYGNTYYVGTHGLSSVLIASEGGHVLIDGALQESAPLIAANIRSLGFRIEDVKLIVTSHAKSQRTALPNCNGSAGRVLPRARGARTR